MHETKQEASRQGVAVANARSRMVLKKSCARAKKYVSGRDREREVG